MSKNYYHRILTYFICLWMAIFTGSAQPIQNPIIPGFHPDPCIVRVQGDYYIVTSTFEWFPGIPIYHSTDLEHWK